MKENKQKITPELLKDNKLVFYPKTTMEAVFIQRMLFELGCKWYWDKSARLSFVEDCVGRGIEVHDGKLFCGEFSGPREALLCTSAQFDKPFDEKDIKNLYVPANQTFILELFNRLSERIDALNNEVAQLRKDIEPKGPGKPKFAP